MKKRFSFFLLGCLLLPLGLWACTENPPESPVKAESLTIAGEDISKFTIVYAPSYSDEFLEQFEEFLTDDYDHNYETAFSLRRLLIDAFGTELPVVQSGSEETEYKILIGASEGYADNEYAVSVDGKTLVITGGSDGAVYQAIGAIQAELSETAVADVVWNAGEILIKGEAKMKRVACIGDSLTEGSIGGHVTPELAYPAALQRLLWKEYNVYNYGLGGTSMINSSSNPYMSSKQYSDCLSSGMTYDVILVMLGTNDSKVIGDTWTDAANDEFMACAKTLFTSLKEKSPNARFAYMNCPVKFTTAGYGNAYMIPVQKEAATLLKAEGFDVTHYDMRAYTTEVLTQANFRDGLHPDYAGYVKFADAMRDLVKYLAEDADNSAKNYLISLD